MNNPTGYFVELIKQPFWVIVWVTLLTFANKLSIVYGDTELGKTILIFFLIPAVAMMALYSYIAMKKSLA